MLSDRPCPILLAKEAAAPSSPATPQSRPGRAKGRGSRGHSKRSAAPPGRWPVFLELYAGCGRLTAAESLSNATADETGVDEMAELT